MLTEQLPRSGNTGSLHHLCSDLSQKPNWSLNPSGKEEGKASPRWLLAFTPLRQPTSAQGGDRSASFCYDSLWPFAHPQGPSGLHPTWESNLKPLAMLLAVNPSSTMLLATKPTVTPALKANIYWGMPVIRNVECVTFYKSCPALWCIVYILQRSKKGSRRKSAFPRSDN